MIEKKSISRFYRSSSPYLLSHLFASFFELETTQDYQRQPSMVYYWPHVLPHHTYFTYDADSHIPKYFLGNLFVRYQNDLIR